MGNLVGVVHLDGNQVESQAVETAVVEGAGSVGASEEVVAAVAGMVGATDGVAADADASGTGLCCQ